MQTALSVAGASLTYPADGTEAVTQVKLHVYSAAPVETDYNLALVMRGDTTCP